MTLISNTIFKRHSILVVSFILLFSTNLLAQKTRNKLEFGFNYGHSVLMHKKSATDGVMRSTNYRLESEKYGSGDLLTVVGGHVNSLGLVVNYHFKDNNYIQLGYNRRIRMISALINPPQIETGANDKVKFVFPEGEKVAIPQYLSFDFRFPQDQEAFFHKSRCIPISWHRTFKIPGERSITINPGVGFAYFKNSVNQVVRKSPETVGSTFDYLPAENQVLHTQMTSRFVDDPYYASNFDLYWNFSLGIQKQFKKGNKIEFDISYMPNFKDPHYQDYIEYTLETSIYDISDPDNHVLVETIDKGTTRFELRQGGITFSLRYYPKAFQMNAGK